MNENLPETLLFGGVGDDSISSVGGVLVGDGIDRLFNTRETADAPDATLRGGGDNDLLSVVIEAGRGVDVLRGGDGNDFLKAFVRPGTARCRMVGGDGADLFFAEGPAIVVDFSLAEGDRIDVPDDVEADPSLIRQELIETDRGTALLISFPVADFPATFTLYGIDAPLPDSAFG